MSDGKDSENGEVGYCRPPKHSQFKKGQSGNWDGRPPKRKSKAGASMLEEFFQFGTEPVDVKDPKTGQKTKVRPRDLVVQKIWSEASKDAKFALTILNLHRTELIAPDVEKEKLTREDEAILARALETLANDNRDVEQSENGSEADVAENNANGGSGPA